MWDAIKSVFGFSGVGETALKIIERVTGTDDSPDKRRQFLLDYLAATKHQSVARRFIAISITLAWLMMVTVWVLSAAIGRFFYGDVINAGTALSADISAFMSLNISAPMNIVIGFYFATHILGGLKK